MNIPFPLTPEFVVELRQTLDVFDRKADSRASDLAVVRKHKSEGFREWHSLVKVAYTPFGITVKWQDEDLNPPTDLYITWDEFLMEDKPWERYLEKQEMVALEKEVAAEKAKKEADKEKRRKEFERLKAEFGAGSQQG